MKIMISVMSVETPLWLNVPPAVEQPAVIIYMNITMVDHEFESVNAVFINQLMDVGTF